MLNTDQFFIASLNGAAQIPAYRAAYLVLYNLNMMSVTVAGASAVFVSHLWQAGQIQEVHRVVLRNLRLGLGIMAGGGACVLVLGHYLFDVWLGRGNFIGHPILIIFFLLLFLEAHCFIITVGSRATEDEAFAFWALGAGLLKLTLSFLLGLRFGLLGIAASTLLAELATNHWYMVYRGLNRLQIRLRDHFVKVLLPVAGLFIVVAAAVSLPVRFNIFSSEWGVVLTSGGIAGVIVAGFMWLFVLEDNQRQRVIAWRPLAG